MFESGAQGHNASLPPCIPAKRPLQVVGEKAVSCRFEDGEMVPPSMGNAPPNMARGSSVMSSAPYAGGWSLSELLPRCS